jgi:Flp pilus assembly protein TadG
MPFGTAVRPIGRRRTFSRDKRGGIAIIFGIALPILAVGVGIAVDSARWFHAKRVTSSALDAAVLAGARTLQINPNDETAALDVARQYYNGNIAGRVSLINSTVDFNVTNGGRIVAATGSADIKAFFLRVAGISELNVVGNAGASLPRASIRVGGRGGSNIEVALALDITGSMCNDGFGPCVSSTKLDGLKAAAKDLVEIVVSATQSPYTSRVALAPFSTRVRVAPDGQGGSIMPALTGLPTTWSGWYRECLAGHYTNGGGSETGGTWVCTQEQTTEKTNWKIMPCVTDRAWNVGDVYDYTDDLPAAGRWLNAHGGNRYTISQDSGDTPLVAGTGASAADASTNWNYDPNGTCADVNQGNEIMPLTSSKSELRNRIDDLEAFGATGGAVGTAWAWYLLSPNWSSIWTGSSTPGAYSDLTQLQTNGSPVLRKVVVIMSDGVYNTMRGWKDQDQQMVSDHAKQLCTNMKAQGIEIFTVALNLNELSAGERVIAEDTLRSCGTDVHHFYDTLTVDEMRAAFRDIALQLSALALTE